MVHARSPEEEVGMYDAGYYKEEKWRKKGGMSGRGGGVMKGWSTVRRWT